MCQYEQTNGTRNADIVILKVIPIQLNCRNYFDDANFEGFSRNVSDRYVYMYTPHTSFLTPSTSSRCECEVYHTVLSINAFTMKLNVRICNPC